ncbi:MAG: coenzyme F420-0:L-glutamate ligase [Oscillospiraceae bacterium]|nr:coenzyme F420-0:L-glutamate ligase [Oscillospiraceae bacterium]
MRTVGTVSRGVRCPIIRKGDNLAEIAADSVLAAAKSEGSPLRDRDIVGVTEAVLARSQGNYATTRDIADDVAAKFGGDTLGVIFPILSRNRFAICLRGIAMGMKKIVLMLNYPSDEVGNPLFPHGLLEDANVNPWSDTLDEAAYREKFGCPLHPFTGVDYVGYYKELIESCGCEAEIIFSNNAKTILQYTGNVLACDIHTREETVRTLRKAGAQKALTLADILNAPVNGSGCNEQYGLLGFNKATEDTVKLWPRDAKSFVDNLARLFLERTGKNIEVLVYGDGAFKDPREKIWELHDPVVSMAYTSGLEGVPNEIKLKYLADNQFKDLDGDALEKAMRAHIKTKSEDLVGSMESQGTTPRQLSDLVGSLCDLTSGSGDKGTPIIWIQGYFDDYAVNN